MQWIQLKYWFFFNSFRHFVDKFSGIEHDRSVSLGIEMNLRFFLFHSMKNKNKTNERKKKVENKLK